MSAAEKLHLMSVADYLARELISPIKHEYLGGIVHAMAGARNRHNEIATNTLGSLHGRLRGKPCRAFNSDTKIRLHVAGQVRFYYPDASVICRPNPDEDAFQDEPAALFEVMSPATRRIDEGEKKDAYLTIPSLNVYVLIEQDFPAVIVYRRTGTTWGREVLQGLDASLALPDLGVEVPLAEIYEGIEFLPAADIGDPPPCP